MDNSFYLEEYENILREKGNGIIEWNKVMNKIKSYLLYYEESMNDAAINSFNDIIVYNAYNIEETEATKTTKNNHSTFINSLKK